ncbi:MAG: hypothetical protein GX491_17450 [Chloroflexi bacterium]|nr:hypothetical protein [Chloroflexota bacterium]
MIDTPSVPKPRESTWLWLFKIISGLLIVVFLGIHFVVNHLLAPQGLLTYEEVILYFKNPIVPVMEVLFLVFVIAHSLTGLRSIFLDLNPSDKLLRAVDIVFIVAGVGFAVYGIWLAWVIASTSV